MKKILTTLALAASLNVQAAPVMNFFELDIAQGQHAEFNQVGKHNIDTSIANEKRKRNTGDVCRAAERINLVTIHYTNA